MNSAPQHKDGTATPDFTGSSSDPHESSMAALLLSTTREQQRRTGNMFAWILIGLISGWLAGKILNGNGYGMMADIGLGLLGGVIGGMIFEVLGVRAHNFVGSILMSTTGATALVIATRIIRDEI
jgi:uncharacterized membrane protein YeaQ/YmgE (transglycosylase-associated protein family)